MNTGAMRRLWLTLQGVCVALLVVCTSGCFRLPTFAPQGVALETSDSTAACEELATLARQGPHAFRALLETSLVTAREESFSFRYAVASKQPDSLRVDLLPMEGAYTLGLLVVRDGQVIVLDSQAKTYSSGCPVRAVFEKFFALQGVTPELVQALITGRAPALRCDAVRAYRHVGGRLLFVDGASRYAWELEEGTGRLHQVTLLDDSLARIQAHATRSYASGDEYIRIDIHRPISASATMKLRKLVLDPQIAAQLFEVSPPPGYAHEGC